MGVDFVVLNPKSDKNRGTFFNSSENSNGNSVFWTVKGLNFRTAPLKPAMNLSNCNEDVRGGDFDVK